jgi:DNA polymerase (family 10)
LNKREIAHILRTMGALLEIKGESPFKTHSYTRAADNIMQIEEDIEEMTRQGRLKEIPGIGKNLEPKVEELVLTGKSTFLEKLVQEIPSGVLDLLRVPGIGAKTARLLYEELGVADLDMLEEALLSHKVSKIPGLGRKREELMYQGLKEIKKYVGKVTAGIALPVAESIAESMRQRGVVSELVGEVRRCEETVSCIELLIILEEDDDVFSILRKSGILPAVSDEELLSAFNQEDRSFSFNTGFGIPLRLFFSYKKEAGIRMLTLTGPKEFLEYLGQVHGNKLEIQCVREKDVFRSLGITYIPPEVRHLDEFWHKSQHGESIRLVDPTDIKGDIHLHTSWSDGVLSIEDMVLACIKMGYSYLAITDHASEIKLINGLDEERIKAQIDEIESLRKKYPEIRIYTGVEVDIGKNGELYLSDDILKKLDVVIASIHNDVSDANGDMLERLMAAAENPNVDIIGHPTGRIIGRRPGYTGDLQPLFKIASKTNTVLEVNCSPDRLDLAPDLVRQGAKMGVKFAITTDSHRAEGLPSMKYGVLSCAKRAGLPPEYVVNILDTLPWLSNPSS